MDQAARRLSFDSAIAVSFLSALFSSSRFCCKQVGAVVATDAARPGDQRAVARDLVVLDGLTGGDERGVQHLLVGDLAGDLVALLQDAVDRRAVDALDLDAVLAEHLLQADDVALGLRQMRLEQPLQLQDPSPCRPSSAAPS